MTYRLRRSRLPTGIALAAAAAAVVIAMLLFGCGDDSGGDGEGAGSKPQPTGGPQSASVDQLRELADSSDEPIYWAGEQSGEIELTVERDGKIYIRYLGPSVEVGSREVPSLTVGTYPYPDAFSAVRGFAKQPGSSREETPDGGIVVSSEASPNNVYIAYPDSDYQVEVFHPEGGRALEIATSGDIVPIQ